MSEQNNGASPSRFALMVRRAANLPEQVWTDERIAVVHRTIAPQEAGAAEVAMFLAVAARYNLDPFAKEIWLAKDKGRLIILTGKDSILKVARSHEDYLGHESDVVYSKDEFEAVHDEGLVKILHRINGFDRGELVGAYSVARKRGHPPQLVIRRWEQYQHLHGKDNWKNYPEDMLLSRVVTAAHRLLYNISGMYTQEEVDSGEAAEELASHEVAQKSRDRLDALKAKLTNVPDEVQDADFEIVEDAAAPDPGPDMAAGGDVGQSDHERARSRFWALYEELGYAVDDLEQESRRHDWTEHHFRKRSFGQLSTDEIRRAIELLERGEGPVLPAVGAEPELEPAAADFPGGVPGELPY